MILVCEANLDENENISEITKTSIHIIPGSNRQMGMLFGRPQAFRFRGWSQIWFLRMQHDTGISSITGFICFCLQHLHTFLMLFRHTLPNFCVAASGIVICFFYWFRWVGLPKFDQLILCSRARSSVSFLIMMSFITLNMVFHFLESTFPVSMISDFTVYFDTHPLVWFQNAMVQCARHRPLYTLAP